METPTISKKQERKTLSAKKLKKETIKNVLAKPYQNYWPCLSPEDNDQLKETLDRFLPRLKNDKISVPYKEIKEIPKDERRKFRQSYTKKDPIEVKETDRRSLIFGVNDVSKSLENREAGSVLVASDVQPRLLVQHILDQAVLYSVPILIVKDLRDILRNNCGISGVVIALRKTIKPDSKLGLIQQTICNIYENYPVSETHINYHRRLEESGLITTSDLDISGTSKSTIILSDSGEEGVKLEGKKCHLMRKADKKRAFVPEMSGKGDMMEADTSIIILGHTSTPITALRNKRAKPQYRPLVVKKLKGNKNRNKTKMEKFKKKQ